MNEMAQGGGDVQSSRMAQREGSFVNFGGKGSEEMCERVEGSHSQQLKSGTEVLDVERGVGNDDFETGLTMDLLC
ncbi:hypothetical protein V6N13_132971 [Hibiscus sabdariffa]